MCMSILVWVFAACSRYLKNEFHADAKWPMILLSWNIAVITRDVPYRSRVEAGLAWRFLGGTRWHAWMDAFFDSGRNELHRNWKKFVYWSSMRCLISRRMIWKSWKQFGVKNIATTGHQLQGMSKDQLIVSSWNYSSKNWIYVVLSRVRTLSGL